MSHGADAGDAGRADHGRDRSRSSTSTPGPASARRADAAAEIVERLNREINAGLDDAGVRKRFADVGAVPIILTPAEARDRIAKDIEKWAKVVKGAGLEAGVTAQPGLRRRHAAHGMPYGKAAAKLTDCRSNQQAETSPWPPASATSRCA